jgi:hypothetical protein
MKQNLCLANERVDYLNLRIVFQIDILWYIKFTDTNLVPLNPLAKTRLTDNNFL